MARIGFSRAKTTRLQSFVKEETRDMTAASGDVAYTGYGFKPSCLIILVVIGARATGSWGFSDSAKTSKQTWQLDNGHMDSGTRVIAIGEAAGTRQRATVKSFDDDGYTLTWTKDGVPAAGGAEIMVLALR